MASLDGPRLATHAPDSESPIPFDDFWPRAIGIPAFGIGIPLVFDLYGPVQLLTPQWLLGQVMFLALAFAIWHGNRHLLFVTAGRFDWLEKPWKRVQRLLLGIVLFTAPLTVVVLAAWFLVGRGESLTAGAASGPVLMNVICVIFVAHVYETVLLLKARETDLVRVAQADRARAESELLALRRQVDPHFLFNCLNTLSSLLEDDPPRARRFNESLAATLRYLLETSERHLVPLAEELAFVRRYAELLSIRFGDAFRFVVTDHGAPSTARVPPTCVQLLLENAIAHNRLSQREPLEVTLELGPDALVVSHPLRPKPDSAGAGVGLRNLADRLRIASNQALSVSDADGRFTVRVPLSEAA